MENKKEKVFDLLSTVIDPEVEVNIVDLGLIYDVNVDKENEVHIEMTFSTPACPIGDVIIEDVRQSILASYPDDEIHINLVFDPPWNASMISEAGKEKLSL